MKKKDAKIAKLVNRMTGANKGLAKKVKAEDIASIRQFLANK